MAAQRSNGLAVRARERLRRVVDVETLLLISLPTAGDDASPARLATRADVPALLELYGPGRFRVQRWRRRRRLVGRLERGDAGLVLEEGGDLVGCRWLSWSTLRSRRYRIPVRPRAGQAYAYGLSVRPDLRGGGLATRLILASLSYANRRGTSMVLSHISPRNPVTPHLFLEKLGAEVMGKVTVVVLLSRFGVPLRTRPAVAASAAALAPSPEAG